MDKPSQDSLKAMLKTLRDQGKLIIASHHDLPSVPQLFDRVILLNGELIAEGPVEEAFTEENIQKTYHTAPFAGPVGHAHHH
jgi:ABC-type Mn2+/Zn2+ transport system ATPase subunit